MVLPNKTLHKGKLIGVEGSSSPTLLPVGAVYEFVEFSKQVGLLHPLQQGPQVFVLSCGVSGGWEAG